MPTKTNTLSKHQVALIVLLGVISIVWVIFDRISKAAFAHMMVGASAGTILGGLIDLRLVHNTGAAWGSFANSTEALAIFSLLVCALLVVYFFWSLKTINVIQVIGIGLIVGGGIGNAIDRFSQGYVIDFLATTFMDFPVFNVADIGVTCGVVLLLIGIALSWYKEADSK